MSLPRKLTLVGDDDIRQTPIAAVESLRYDPVAIADLMITPNRDVVIDEIKGDAMELYIEVEPNNQVAFFIDVLASPDRQEYTRIAFFQERGYSAGRNYRVGSVIPSAYVKQVDNLKPALTARRKNLSVISLETANSSTLETASPRPPETASFLLAEGETVKLRIFIDKSVVEVFANDKQVVACRVYPSRSDATGVSLRSQGKAARIKSLQAWQMKSIYR